MYDKEFFDKRERNRFRVLLSLGMMRSKDGRALVFYDDDGGDPAYYCDIDAVRHMDIEAFHILCNRVKNLKK